MRTSLMVVGVMGALTIASQTTLQGSNEKQTSHTTSPIIDVTSQAVWVLEASNNSHNCILEISLELPARMRGASQSGCEQIIPGFSEFSKLDANSNGDITLYGNNNEKLAQFIESESGYHESIWPTHPLMTLAKID